ncbi:efflux RND transporter periplasmic adaptor subunit [Celeribacter sp.]|uniref:efflux RND transporter periplasmic adaptor subunit n=1 Tax=Celeribacter sp. TaxID=1890673 RepID=UPI003A935676
MRFLRRSLTGLFLLCLTVGLLAAGGYQFYASIKERASAESRPRAARERQFAVNVVTVEPSRLVPVLSTYGEIRARKTLELRMPSGGRIVELNPAFEEGGSVSEGDVLIRVDPTTAQAALRVAEADLQEAEAERADAENGVALAEDDLAAAQAQLDLRSAALARQENLSERGVGTASAVETAALSEASARQAVLSRRQALASAKARLDQAATGVLRAEIALDDARRAVEDTALVASFDGILTGVSAALGGLVNANEQVGSLIAPDELEVAFRISTEQYSRVAGGAGVPDLPVTVSLDVSGVNLSAQGRVTRESAAVGDGQTGRLLFAALEDVAGLRPGDFVTVEVEEAPLEGVALVPASAVDAAQTVLAVSAESRLEVIDAPVLRRQGDEVIIDARAVAGRQIVAERSPLLGAGIRVRVNGAEEGADGAEAAAPEGRPSGGELVELDEERRAKLIAFVDSNTRMPEEARARIKEQLSAEKVPAELIERLESRMGA